MGVYTCLGAELLGAWLVKGQRTLSLAMAAAPWMRSVSKHLKEVRIHLCQTSGSSKGVREFIEKYYVTLKENNQTFPFLIRECSGVEPKLYGRYSYGVESSVSLADKNGEEVLAMLEKMATTEVSDTSKQ